MIGGILFLLPLAHLGKKSYLNNVKGISPERERKPVSQPLTRVWETGWTQNLFLSGHGIKKASAVHCVCPQCLKFTR